MSGLSAVRAAMSWSIGKPAVRIHMTMTQGILGKLSIIAAVAMSDPFLFAAIVIRACLKALCDNHRMVICFAGLAMRVNALLVLIVETQSFSAKPVG